MSSGFFSTNREDEISAALLKQPIDLDSLRLLSREKGGFINNNIRSRVWPKLLGVNRYTIPDYRTFVDPHRDDSQVRCDVDRSLWNFNHIVLWKDSFREKRRKALSDIIMAILCRNSGLYYYQGFHDVVSIFLLVLEEDHLAFALSEAMSLRHLSDYMNRDFDVVSQSMRLVLVLVRAADEELHAFLKRARVEPFFATSWLITWFAHDVKSVDDVARIYDALLASHPMMCFYLCAVYVVHLRDDLFGCDCDFAAVHNLLVHAPATHGVPFEALLPRADALMKAVPVSRLKTMCDETLTDLIAADQIALLSRPYDLRKDVDADWLLMKQAKVQPPSSVSRHVSDSGVAANSAFPVVQYCVNNVLTSWGWSPGPAVGRSSSGSAVAPSPGRRGKRNGRGRSGSDGGGGEGSGFMSRNAIMWSLAAIMGGILGYALAISTSQH